MLKGNVNTISKLEINGFLIAVEVEKGVIEADAIGNKLADALTFMEGTGQVEVSHLGVMELVPEDAEGAMQIFADDEGSSTTIKES